MKQVLIVNWSMWCPIRMAKWSMLAQNPTLFVGVTLRAGRICNKKPKKLPENENLLEEKKNKKKSNMKSIRDENPSGLRAARKHGAAAYLASLSASQ